MDKSIKETKSDFLAQTTEKELLYNIYSHVNGFAKDLLWNKFSVHANTKTEYEIVAGKYLAFKPHFMRIKSFNEKQIESGFELISVKFADIPISRSGDLIHSSFFNEKIQIECPCLGASQGQGLKFDVINRNDFKIDIYILLYGNGAYLEDVDNYDNAIRSLYLKSVNEKQKLDLLDISGEEKRQKKLEIDEQYKKDKSKISRFDFE